MENGGKKLFRTALGGFNKDDVMRYIETLTQDHERTEGELSRRAESLEKENASLKSQASELMAKLEETLARAMQSDNKAAQLEQECAELREKNRLLAEENEALSNSEQEKRCEIRSLKERAAQLEAELSELSAKASEYEEKAKAYENLSRQAGDIMLKARQSADLMIGDAIFRSNNIKEKTENYLKKVKEGLESFKSQALAAKARLENSARELESSKEAFFSYLNEIESAVALIETDESDGSQQATAAASAQKPQSNDSAASFLDKIMSDINKKRQSDNQA